jgi:protein-disulfide isomerase
MRLHQLALAGFVAAGGLFGPDRPAATAAEVAEGAIGSATAPVTVIEYSSLTCPHCAAFHEETLPGLKARFIDTGKVRLVTRDFPLDQPALQAAVLAHCAGPARYPTFVDVFFTQQENWARAPDPVAALKQLAQLGGLPATEADACLADKAMEEAVLQMRLAGQQQFDIRSTPTFIIQGKAYPGNRSVDEFAAIIEPLLAGGTGAAAPAQPAPAQPAAPQAALAEPAAPAPVAPPAPAAATPAPAEPAPAAAAAGAAAEPEPTGVVDRALAWLRGLFG